MSRGDTKPLNSQRYHGLILDDVDPLNKGRYKVWISELMHQIPKTEGIWCKNRIHKERIIKKDPKKDYRYGTYHPLRKDTEVIVTFYENDYNTGFIIERESDQENDCLPFNAKKEDRDDIYLIQNTQEHTFIMLDKTISLPEHSIHLYWKEKKHKIILNDKGMHIFVTGDFNVTVKEDMNIDIKKNLKIKVGENIDVKGNGHINHQCTANINWKTGAVVNIEGGKQNHKGDVTSDPILGTITYADISGGHGPKPSIKAPPAEPAAPNVGYDTKSPKEVPWI